MTTTFDVFYLGVGPLIDPTEGNETPENAAALVGTTYGSVGNPLHQNIHEFSPGTNGFGGGNAAGYDVDNNLSNDQFRIDGGPDQTFDAAAIYDVTITYSNGTTAAITATIFQDTSGNLYLMPETGSSPETTSAADQAALEANPIRSVTINSVNSTMPFAYADRFSANYSVCFTSGTAIRTPRGDRLIEELDLGDLVTTMDNSPQPIQWIGKRTLDKKTLDMRPNLRPIVMPRGFLNLERRLVVSPQHGMLLGRDHLARAKHLVAVPGCPARVANGVRKLTYIHLFFESHQVIFAEGAASEESDDVPWRGVACGGHRVSR